MKNETTALVEKWRGRSSYSAELELRKYGINCREPYVMLNPWIMFQAELPEDSRFRVYDGAVMSEDGKFVALIPKKNVIKSNRDTYLNFRYSSLCFRNLLDRQEKWSDRKYFNPTEIFAVYMMGLYENPGFHILIDDDNLY